MKNWKHWAFVAIIAIFPIIVGFVACDNSSEEEQPKKRSAEKIYFGTDNALFTNISSEKALLDEEWINVKNKLKTALDAASKSTASTIAENTTVGDVCFMVFGGIINMDIDLVETREYNYCVDMLKFLFSADYVIKASESDLFEKVTAAVKAAGGDGSLQAKAIQPKHDKKWHLDKEENII